MADERVYQVRGGGEIVVRGSVPAVLLQRIETLVERGHLVVMVPCEGEMRSVLFALGRLSSAHERLRRYRLRLDGEEKDIFAEYEQFIESVYDSARKLDKRFGKLHEKVRKRMRRKGNAKEAPSDSQGGGEEGAARDAGGNEGQDRPDGGEDAVEIEM